MKLKSCVGIRNPLPKRWSCTGHHRPFLRPQLLQLHTPHRRPPPISPFAPGEKWGFSKRKWGLKGGGKSPHSKQKWELKVGVYTAKNRPKIGQNVEKIAKIARKVRFSTGADAPTQAICWKMSCREKFFPFSHENGWKISAPLLPSVGWSGWGANLPAHAPK